MIKNNIILLILIFVRCADWITTYIATSDLYKETSPLVRLLHFGWTEIIIFNLILLIAIIFSYKYFVKEKYLQEMEYRMKPRNLKDYYCKVIFKEKNNSNILQLLLNGKVNMNVFLNFSMRSLVITLIILSLLASINNLLVYANTDLLNKFSSFQISQIVSIVTVVFFIIIFYILVKNRFGKIKTLFI